MVQRRRVETLGELLYAGRYPGSERFELRHIFCPGCATQIDVHIAQVHEDMLDAIGTGPLPDDD